MVFKSQLVLQLLVPGSGYVPNTARKRPLDMVVKTGTTQATEPRQSVLEKRITREKGVSASSCLHFSSRSVQSAGRCNVCHFAHARPVMLSISLVV